MTAAIPNAAAHVQRQLNDVSAKLAQLARETPDILVYLKAHAECVLQVLRPQGLAYEMLGGKSFQRMVASNWDSLGLRDNPELAESFRKALHRVVETGHPVALPARLQPQGNLPGLQPQDAPAPEELSLFNTSPFEQFFTPIVSAGVVVGVHHAWFAPIDAQASQLRAVILRQICGEVELYLKARRSGDLAAEVARVSTYAKLLEEIAGDSDVESVGWHIVNYARETVGCDRVSLLVAKGRGDEPVGENWIGLDQDYELGASSGLRRPHPRSEQAVILKRLAERLTQMSLANSAKRKAQGKLPGAPALNGHAKKELVAVPPEPEAAPGEPAPEEKPEEGNRPAKANGSARPTMQLTLVQRDPTKTATRPEEVNEYFEAVPMNWATVMPLFDRQERVRGILLFEGIKKPEKLDSTILQMRDLAISAGRTLGAALYWERQPAARVARRWIGLRTRVVNTPRREKWMRFGLPALIVTGILLCPMSFEVKGDAKVLPDQREALTPPTPARILSVEVREGEAVKKDQVLARLDTSDLLLAQRAAQQEYERAWLDLANALDSRDDTKVRAAQVNLGVRETQRKKVQADLERLTVRAPFDGVVWNASALASRIGQVARLGEPVLEVIKPDTWKARIDLREQDLRILDRTLQENPTIDGSIRLAANPIEAFPITLSNREQLREGLDTTRGEYIFQVEVPLAAAPTQLDLIKSGMAGRASFHCGRRPIAYLLFRDFVNFLRLRFF